MMNSMVVTWPFGLHIVISLRVGNICFVLLFSTSNDLEICI